jgi:DNA polymerase-3 subunit alpha
VVKIISRKSLGVQPVYDIGVERDHRFILKTGLVASNCFNKSHSTAYGYVTYQTAYLKANFPVEYMAALLTANSDKTEQVQKYIATCLNMNIQIEPPDVNRSGVDFTPIEDNILFGLSAVKGVGGEAIASILKARQDGEFKSLADFCDRVDLRAVTRRTIEPLIYCGAFDKLEPNRQQLLKDLELVHDWAQSRAKDRAIGQFSLFDLGGMTNASQESSFDSAPKAPAVADFQQSEKLRKEKELLGFYVSDHPLKAVRQAAQILSPINLSDLENVHSETSVSSVVMLTSMKPVTTKKGDRMAILQLEDLTGQTEAVVFPKTYERISHLLVADTRLIVWGKVDRRDDKVQMILEDVDPVESVQLVMVELDPLQAGNIQEQHRLQEILQQQVEEKEKAKIPVFAIISDAHHRQLVRLGRSYWVQDSRAAVEALITAKFPAHVQPLLVGNG